MQTTNNINLSCVRLGKKEAMLQAYREGIVKKDNLKVQIYKNAIISPYTEQSKIWLGGGI